MTEVLLSLGSNIQREASLTFGLDRLSELLDAFAVSPVFESEAVGFIGPAFFNLVVRGETSLSLDDLVAELKSLERTCGRPENSERFASKTLDIDVLTFGEKVGCFQGIELPRPEILYNAFVLWPLAELVPTHMHPVLGTSYQDLWAAFESSQRIQPAAFYWSGTALIKN